MADNDTSPKTNIMNKLNYLDDTKQQIRSALREKGQQIPSHIPFRDYAQIIKDIEIGTDTSDATATEYDIISPYTAYSQNRKITGQIPKVEDNFSFDNLDITQENEVGGKLIRDHTMTDGQTFHKEYLDGVNLDGRDFLIYMRPNSDESTAIIFTWYNTEDITMTLNNNTMTLNADHLVTYTDLFITGSPTITEGPYSGIYFGNTSYLSTQNIYEEDTSLIFEQTLKLNYDYLTFRQSFDSTKAITSNARNRINIDQKDLAKMVGLVPDILRSGNKIMGVDGTMEPTKLFHSYNEMDNSQGNNVNDYAVLYHREINDLPEIHTQPYVYYNTKVTTKFFPDTIVMDNEITENLSPTIYLSNLNYSYEYGSSLQITPTYIQGSWRVRTDITGITYNYCDFRYSSSDGITYTLDYKTDNFPNQVVLEETYNDTLYIIPKLLKIYDYSYEGIYQYTNKTNVELFNAITDIKCVATTASGETTYSYYSENERIRLPKLRETLVSINIEEERLTSSSNAYYSIIKTKLDNKLHMINKSIYLIYSHTANKTYACINESTYSDRIINQYSSEFSEKTTKILTQKLNDTYYIIGELNNDIIFIGEGYCYWNGSTPSFSSNFYPRYFLNNTISTMPTTNIKYNNTTFEAYHNADLENNLLYKYQLAAGIQGVGAHGTITGDGSNINHITNRQFADNYLKGNTGYNSYNKCLNGTQVPNQTFVSNEQIKANYKTGVDIEQGDEVTYHNESSIPTTIDLNDNTFLDEFNECDYSTVSNTFYEGQIPYYIKIKFEGTKSTAEDEYNVLWNNITKVTAVIFNQLTGEIFKTFKCTTAFTPVDNDASSNYRNSGYMLNCGYSFSEDKLYILFSTGGWGWSNSAYGSTITISNTGVLTKKAWSFVPSGSNIRTYKQIDQSGTVWDDVNNQFYGYVETFDTNGSNTAYNGIAKIDMNGATHIRQNTDATKSSYASNSRGQGPLFQYKDGATQKYVLLDASNNTIVLQNMDNTLNIIGINGYQYYAYNGNLYKYNPSTHSATIINNEFIGTKVNRLFVDGIEYLHNGDHEGKIYDTDGNYIKDITNVSANQNIEEIDDYHRKVIGTYSSSVIDYSSGSRTTTKYDYIRSYKKWFDIKSFPFEGELWLTFGSTTNTRLNYTYKSSAKQLSKDRINKKDLNEVDNNLREVLGENE